MFWNKDRSPKKEDTPADGGGEDVGIITLYKGITAAGKDFWAVLKVLPDQYVALKKSQHDDTPINLFDFGDVLDRGYGEHPPEEVFEDIRKKYAIRHHSDTFIVDKES